MKKGHKKWLVVALVAVGVIAPVIAPPRIAALLQSGAQLLAEALDEDDPEEADKPSAS